MTVRICYVERALRGEAITGLRLVSERSELCWSSPGPPDDNAPDRDVSAAAAWLSQQAPSGIDVLCLDGDGTLLSWLSSASRDPEVVGVVARQTHDAGGGLHGVLEAPVMAHAALADYADTPDGASVVVLGGLIPDAAAKNSDRRGAKVPAKAERLAVMAVNDVPARLLIDALDSAGIEVASTTTIYQAMAAVWDPAARPASESARGLDGSLGIAGAVVAESTPVTAVVIVDPGTGRVHWVWSRSGVLLAGESLRVASEPISDTHSLAMKSTGLSGTGAGSPSARYRVHPRPADASRVASSWLAWAAELGVAPARVLLLSPEAPFATGVPEFGRGLAQAFDAAVVDMREEADPVGLTLTKLAERVDDAPVNRGIPRGGASGGPAPVFGALIGPSQRPTRSHRRAIVLMSLGVAAVAAAVGVFAYRLRAEAGAARAAAVSVENFWRKDVESVDATFLQNPEQVPDKLAAYLNKLRVENKPKAFRADAKPILDELSTLSMVAGDAEIHLVEISMASSFVTLKVHANLEQATAIEQALREISGSQLTGWSSNPGRQVGDLFEYTLRATWVAADSSAAPGGAR